MRGAGGGAGASSVAADRPLLEADGLGRSFGRNVVLKSAGFAVRAGRITALMGRNGAGKTTIFRIAAGRLRPDYGRVVYRGRYLARPSLARLAPEGLMYSAQESLLTPLFTVRGHFHAFVETYGGGDRMEAVVDEMRLSPLMDRRTRQLSGGERRRASLGLALVRSPDCLLMDEPFQGVAPLDLPLVTEGLRRLRRQGTAVAISGHDVEEILGVADEVIWVTSGTTHWLGSPGEARRHHQFRREYLGPGELRRAPRPGSH